MQWERLYMCMFVGILCVFDHWLTTHQEQLEQQENRQKDKEMHEKPVQALYVQFMA